MANSFMMIDNIGGFGKGFSKSVTGFVEVSLD